MARTEEQRAYRMSKVYASIQHGHRQLTEHGAFKKRVYSDIMAFSGPGRGLGPSMRDVVRCTAAPKGW